ncbi:hypothetical protein JCM5353_000828 [Sporobolomyces roseus]
MASAHGNRDQCTKANEEIQKIIEAAREAWYSQNPTTKVYGYGDYEKVYRKHSSSDRYFYLEEPIHSKHQIRELVNDELKIVVTFSSGIAGWHSPETAARREELYGETFTSRKADPKLCYHSCFDGSFKQLDLRYDPNLPYQSTPPIQLEITPNTIRGAFYFNKLEVNARMWAGFERNETVNKSIAHSHLLNLIQRFTTSTRSQLESIKSRTARAGLSNKVWYEFAPNSKRYFRETSKGDIEEYHQARSLITKPTLHSSSLSHRKARIYGFDH